MMQIFGWSIYICMIERWINSQQWLPLLWDLRIQFTYKYNVYSREKCTVNNHTDSNKINHTKNSSQPQPGIEPGPLDCRSIVLPLHHHDSWQIFRVFIIITLYALHYRLSSQDRYLYRYFTSSSYTMYILLEATGSTRIQRIIS